MADVFTKPEQPAAQEPIVAEVRSRAALEPPSSGRVPWMKREWSAALLFLSPTLVVFSVFILFPILFSFFLSFHEWNMFAAEQEFVGLANYTRLLSDPEFWAVFRHTAVYTIGTVPLNMALALMVAYLLKGHIIGKKFLRTAFFTPVIISAVAAAVIWRWVFDPNLGLLNQVLGMIGIPAINWMNDPTAAMVALITVGVWKTFGINMILFAAGLAGIPDHYYEAAEIDGAGTWAKFWKITVPLLSPTTLFVMVLSIIGSFQVFDLVYVLTYGGPLGSTKVLVFYLYEHAFRYFNMGYASAVAYILFAVVFVLTMLQIRFFRDQVYGAT
jgi:multiple sugar transport system permease protein